MEWVDASKEYPELLSCQALGYNISATTDVMAAHPIPLHAGNPRKAIRLLMDIRKKISALHICQAEARLLLANILNPESRPVLVRLAPEFALAISAQRTCLDIHDSDYCTGGPPRSSTSCPETFAMRAPSIVLL